MEHHSEAFVALDTTKLHNAVAIADAGTIHSRHPSSQSSQRTINRALGA